MTDAISASSASKVRPAMLQLVDHRGNVVVVDGGTRLTGQVRSLPAFFSEGSEIEIVLIVGFEPVQLRVVVVEGCECRPGAIAVISMVEWVAGGRRFRPDDGARRDRRIDDALPTAAGLGAGAGAGVGAGAGLKGRLEDMSLVDVVQMLNSGRRTGVVDVRAADSRARALSGRLGLDGGRIVWADVRVDADHNDGANERKGDCVGEDALFTLLAAARGRFAVAFDAPPPGENITRDTTFLLLEFLRQLDEGGREAVPTEGRTGSWSGLVPQLESQLESRAESAVIRPAMASPPSKTTGQTTGQTRLIPAAPSFAPALQPGSPASEPLRPGFEVVRASTMALPPPLPEKTVTASKKRRASLPPQPEREPVSRPTGRFAGFFAELQQSAPDGPPPSFDDGDDADLPVTDAVRFASLDATVTGSLGSTLSTTLGAAGPFGPGDRDTDIVDRALISASSG